MYIVRAQVYNRKTDRYEQMYLDDSNNDIGWSTQHAALFVSDKSAATFYRVYSSELDEKYKYHGMFFIEV